MTLSRRLLSSGVQVLHSALQALSSALPNTGILVPNNCLNTHTHTHTHVAWQSLASGAANIPVHLWVASPEQTVCSLADEEGSIER